MRRSNHKIPKNGRRIFFAQGLDSNSRRTPVAQITLRDEAKMECSEVALQVSFVRSGGSHPNATFIE
jgi:hypothetical protein